MVRPYTPPGPNGAQPQHGRQIDRLLRDRTAVPQYLDDLSSVSAFKMAHRQHMVFNKYLGVWAPLNPMDLPYGFLDPPVLGTTSPFVFRDDYNVVGASFCCTTTGSSSSIVTFQLNGGAPFLTLTLGSGVSVVTGTVSAVGFVANSDILTVTLTTIGTGVAGLGGGIRLN